MRYEDIYIVGTGAWYPRTVPVDEAIADGRYSLEAQRGTGQQRVAVADTETQPEMAVRAGRQALERSGLPASRFSLLLHGVGTHNGLDGWNAAAYLQHHVLDGHGVSFEIHQLSNSAVGSLELACAYLAASPDSTAAMITAADQFGPSVWDRWRAAPPIFVFADGASAVALSRARGFARVASVVTVADTELEGMQRGAVPFSPNPEDGHPIDFFERVMAFADTLPAGLDEARARMAEAMRQAGVKAFAEAGTDASQVQYVVTPGLGREALWEQCLDPLGLDIDQSTWSFIRQVGHAGCTDPFGGLNHLVERGRLRPGDRVLVTGVGGGYNATVAVLEIVAEPPGSGAS